MLGRRVAGLRTKRNMRAEARLLGIGGRGKAGGCAFLVQQGGGARRLALAACRLLTYGSDRNADVAELVDVLDLGTGRTL